MVDEAISELSPDVVHVHTPFPLMSPAVFTAAHRRGVATVATSHSFHYNCPNGIMRRAGSPCQDCVGRVVKYPAIVHRCCGGGFLRSAVPVVSLAVHRSIGTFAEVDRWLANSQFGRERLIAEGLDPAKVVVLSPSEPDPGTPKTDRERTVLFLGRLVPEKGVATLLEGWAQAAVDAQLIVAGAGPLEEMVRAAAAADPSVTFAGELDHEIARDTLARAELLVFPSEWFEGLGMVLVEAFAAGTPVLASDVGNFCEFVTPGVNGAHFRSGDPASLAGALRHHFTEADRPALREGARATYLREFDSDRQIAKLVEVYRAAIADRQAG